MVDLWLAPAMYLDAITALAYTLKKPMEVAPLRLKSCPLTPPLLKI